MTAPINILRGDAVARPKILQVGPPDDSQLDGRFEFEVGGSGKMFVAEGWDAAAIVAAWPKTVPEFREITPSVASGSAYQAGALLLTGPSDGTPFEIEVRATAVVTITTVTAGAATRNEVQRVTLPGTPTGGTFTLTYSDQTTAGIAYNATAAAVQTALEALSNIAPGDVAVSLVSAGVYDVEFTGTLAATEQPEMTLNPASLTGVAAVTVETVADGQAGSDTDYDVTLFRNCWLWYGTTPITITVGVTTAGNIESALEAADGAGWTVTGSGNSFNLTKAGSLSFATFDLSTSNTAVTGGETCGSIEGTNGRNPRNETQRVTVANAGAGTFTLTFDGETTAGIAYNAAASAVKSALEALSNVTTVNVSGSAGNWLVEFTDPGAQDVAEMTATSSLTAGGGSVVERVGHSAGVSEVQTIELPASVTGGSFVLIFEGDRSDAIDYDASAADLDTALEGIEAIGSGGATVALLSPRKWQVTFTAKADQPLLSADASGLTVGTASLLTLAQAAAGPTHWNDPLNWTLLRPPESGDEVWLDLARRNVKHSLRQRTGFSLGDADTDTLLADGSMHFAEGQKVTLRTTDTLPGGLSAGDYYVRDPDEANRTFKLSATRTGDPVNLTSGTGTGTHTAVVELDSLHVAARYTGDLGLPRWNSLGYWEYRPQYLAVGLKSSGAKLVKVGEGDGQGTRRTNIDLGPDAATVEVIQTGGGAENGVPACLLLNDNTASSFTQDDGDAGLAVFPDESSKVNDFTVRGGNVRTGEGVTIVGPVRAKRGTVFGRYLDSAGVSHRWE